MKIQRLDNRHTGVQYFEYYVNASGDVNKFLDWRDWAIDSWGVGVERDLIKRRPDCRWAWTSEKSIGYRIYFRTQQELNWFVLRWS